MTGGSAEEAIDQLLAAINQGKDLPRRYQPGVTLGFPDLDVFTPEALDRIKALAGGDPARTARLSAHVLKIAQRECAVPVLPDLVDDAAAQIDLEHAESEDAPPARPDDEHSAPRTDSRPVAPRGLPLAEPSARHDPGRRTGGPQTGSPQTGSPRSGGAAPGVSAPRRRVRRSTLVLGVLLVAAGVAGSLAYTGQLDTLGDTRKIVTSGLAAIGVVPPGGQRQEGRSGDSGASSPAEPTAERAPPAGSSGGAAVPQDDERDETSNEAVAAGHPLREDDRREDDRLADEAALAERWPELGEAAEDAIKQRFREVRAQAEQARQALEEIGSAMEQLHRRQHEEMQARHARERFQAGAEGADAVARTHDRHQQERAALQRDQKANQDRLAAVHDELDQQLQNARRDVARARTDAAAEGESGAAPTISGPHLHEQPGAPVASSIVVAAPPEDGTGADPLAAESGLRPQSDQTDDRQQQSAATTVEPGAESGERPSENPAETSGIGVVASGQPKPPQDKTSEPAAPQMDEVSTNDEEAAPRARQPLPPSPPSSPPAAPAPGAADGAAGTAAPDAAEAAPAPAEGQPASESPPAAAPAGQDVADLVNRGNALLDLGDLASARLFYRLAADGGSPEGAMLMGMTFDPVYFARTGIQGTQPQIQDALHWYDKAIAMGSRPAERRREELRSWLERSAAAGDARAKAELQQLR
jgi:hypothetical protein